MNLFKHLIIFDLSSKMLTRETIYTSTANEQKKKCTRNEEIKEKLSDFSKKKKKEKEKEFLTVRRCEKEKQQFEVSTAVQRKAKTEKSSAFSILHNKTFKSKQKLQHNLEKVERKKETINERELTFKIRHFNEVQSRTLRSLIIENSYSESISDKFTLIEFGTCEVFIYRSWSENYYNFWVIQYKLVASNEMNHHLSKFFKEHYWKAIEY
ncbi:CLUMA_CG003092, isoform A [Clunio marinus]|uniref:CLUMA_CG003092, isoform A n=1 Tax=Clunio marinus TaxID=568069 RepID=A0A1J1HMQ8_9DIPT|nr:CLUMA_CG003092, isoform A [Clunio marinus]